MTTIEQLEESMMLEIDETINSEVIKNRSRVMWQALQMIILRTVPINWRFENGVTMLIWASSRKYDEIVEYCILRGADINVCDDRGFSALIWAIQSNSISTVKLLIQKNIDINIRDNNGLTALDWVNYYRAIHDLGYNNSRFSIYKGRETYHNDHLCGRVHDYMVKYRYSMPGDIYELINLLDFKGLKTVLDELIIPDLSNTILEYSVGPGIVKHNRLLDKIVETI